MLAARVSAILTHGHGLPWSGRHSANYPAVWLSARCRGLHADIRQRSS